jgi:hypothetical protein
MAARVHMLPKMSTALFAALAGALVAFLGTALLQRSQFRRAELSDVRERLGLTRGLRADLLVTRMVCEQAMERKHLAPGTQYPVHLWRDHGHRLIAALKRPAEAALIDVFGRMEMLNGILGIPALAASGIAFSVHDKETRPGDFAARVELLIQKIDTATEILDRYESECEDREAGLRYPIRASLLNTTPKNPLL